MSPSIADLWHRYAEHIVPADAGPVQIRESKRAYYMGAHGVFHSVLGHMLKHTPEETMEFLRQLQQEFVEFRKKVASGQG